MSTKLLLHRALKTTGTVFLGSALMLTLLSSLFINVNAQTSPSDREADYKKLSEILAKTGKVEALVSASVDPKLNQEYLEKYARSYAKYFPEFNGERTDGSEKKDLPPVFADIQTPLIRELKSAGLEITKTSFYSPEVNVFIKSQDQLKTLFASKTALKIQENETNITTLSSSNPVIKARDSWDSGVNGGGKNKIVAILDTGVQSNHPFLSGKVNIQACFSTSGAGVVSNCPSGANTQYGVGSAAPCTYSSSCSHGTHVAGIAAGKSANLLSNYHGVARDADIMAVQVFSRFNNAGDCGASPTPCTKSYTQDQIDGLNYVGLGALIQAIFNSTKRIVSANMSLGSNSTTTSYCDADTRKPIIDTLKNLKVATVIAAGNSGSFGISTPGCISSAVTVGATNNLDVVTYNRHPNLDLFAPGVGINSSIPVSTYGPKSGTSMAAPMVAGAFAILSARLPANSVNENLKVLQDTGVNVSYTNSGTNYTEKRLRLCKNYVKIGTIWYCNFFIAPPVIFTPLKTTIQKI
jgi:subtilisin family serine protease